MAFDSNQTTAIEALRPLVPYLAPGRRTFANDLIRKSGSRKLSESQFFWVERLAAIGKKRKAEGVTPETSDATPESHDDADDSKQGATAATASSGAAVDADMVKRIVRSVLNDVGATPDNISNIAIDMAKGVFKAEAANLASGINKNIATWIDDAVAKATAKTVKIEIVQGGKAKLLEGHHHPKFQLLLKVCTTRQANGSPINVWIAGPAASGKTTAARNVARALDIPFHFNGAVSMAHELLGFVDAAGKYHRTAFREAFENGGVYLFDEVDGSDNSPLLALNAALANDVMTFPDKQVSRHKDCIVIACANTWGLGATADYVGRAKIDAAFLSRFPVRIHWDYDEDLELKISGNVEFVRRVQKARATARRNGLKVLICPRMSMAGSALVNAGMTADEAAEATYLANLTQDQRRQVEM